MQKERLTFDINGGNPKFELELALLVVLSIVCFLMMFGFIAYACTTTLTRDELMMLTAMVLMPAGLGIWSGLLARRSWEERQLWLGIRGGELVLEVRNLCVANILLEGPERENLRRQKQAAVKIPWASILKFEISPPRVSGKRSTPAYWIIRLSGAESVFYVRRSFFKGREKEILAAIQARLPISMEIRDDLN